MSPTVSKYNRSNDYEAQGQIVHELRNLSTNHKIPILTATQNVRSAENVFTEQTNMQLGDSYKKARYSDFIYMCRMRSDLSILSENVREHIFLNGEIPAAVHSNQDKFTKLVIFETKITKSKESSKNHTKFSIFCTDNLRIYDNIEEYINDTSKIEQNSSQLEAQISTLEDLSSSTIEDFLI